MVSRDGSDFDELPRVGTKRSVKERLGNQLDASAYGSDAVSKRCFLFPSYLCIESKALPFFGKHVLCFVCFWNF